MLEKEAATPGRHRKKQGKQGTNATLAEPPAKAKAEELIPHGDPPKLEPHRGGFDKRPKKGPWAGSRKGDGEERGQAKGAKSGTACMPRKQQRNHKARHILPAMDTLGIEARVFRMQSGCDTTTP